MNHSRGYYRVRTVVRCVVACALTTPIGLLLMVDPTPYIR